MNWELLLSIIAMITSIVVAVGGYRKSRSESINLDVDTIQRYQKALREAHDDYTALCDELEKARIYNQALVEQLRSHSIVPYTLEEVLKRQNRVI